MRENRGERVRKGKKNWGGWDDEEWQEVWGQEVWGMVRTEEGKKMRGNNFDEKIRPVKQAKDDSDFSGMLS